MVKQSYENKGFRDLKEINLPLDIPGKYGVLREYEGRKVGVKDGSEQIILRGFIRLNKSLDQLSVNEDRVAENLQSVRENPSEAMVAILRGEKWIHSKYGVGHDFVKELGKRAKKENKPLLLVALEDNEFREVYDSLSEKKKSILSDKLEYYVGSAFERAKKNIEYVRSIYST